MSPGIPARLSDQQAFILAYMRTWVEERRGGPPGEFTTTVPPVDVSRAVAAEFDEGGDRVGEIPTPEDLHNRLEAALADGDRFRERLAREAIDEGRHLHDRPPTPHLTAVHSASFSRSLDRLEDRDLVDSLRGLGRDEPKRIGLRLTDEGEAVADEVLRRTRDGRYALSFETID